MRKVEYKKNPNNIMGPAGNTITPTMREVRMGNEIRTEAHYNDPHTGQFITKQIVDVRPVKDEPK
tara:strand:+ start:20135 stop:20329 length:195 start_codon:yes stop_codon:yes gene_type:complete